MIYPQPIKCDNIHQSLTRILEFLPVVDVRAKLKARVICITPILCDFIGHIEHGTRIVSLETLVAICNALESTPGCLPCDSLEQKARSSPANITEQEVVRLRKQLQGAMDILDRMDAI